MRVPPLEISEVLHPMADLRAPAHAEMGNEPNGRCLPVWGGPEPEMDDPRRHNELPILLRLPNQPGSRLNQRDHPQNAVRLHQICL